MKFGHKTAEMHSLCKQSKNLWELQVWEDIISVGTWDQKPIGNQIAI